MDARIVYLMRGLPSCGKSETARRLAGEAGVICETDSFFQTEVGEDPETFDYDRARMDEAREWNFARFTEAVDGGATPVVVDRGNSLSIETQRYARYARDAGYTVELAEPDSPWWQEIRVLLKYKQLNRVVLKEWAKRLAQLSRATHRVPVEDILRLMAKWRYDLTIGDILEFDPEAWAAARGRPAPRPANDSVSPEAIGPLPAPADDGAKDEQEDEDALWIETGAGDEEETGGRIEWDGAPSRKGAGGRR